MGMVFHGGKQVNQEDEGTRDDLLEKEEDVIKESQAGVGVERPGIEEEVEVLEKGEIVKELEVGRKLALIVRGGTRCKIVEGG